MDKKPSSSLPRPDSAEVSDLISDTGSPRQAATTEFVQVVNCASRDIYCFFILLAVTIFSILVSIYCFTWGDIERLTRGWDFRAELCGVDELDDKAYVYFPDPQESTDIRICMAGCPAFNSRSTVCFYETDHESAIADIPCYDAKPAKPYYNRYCIPADEDDRDEVLEVLDDGMIRLSLWAGDVGRVWDVLAIGGLISFGTVLVIVTWFSIGYFIRAEVILAGVGAAGLTVILGYLMYREGYRLEDDLCDDFGPIRMYDCDYDAAVYAHIVLSSFIYLGALVILLTLILAFPKMKRGISIIRLSWRPVGSVWTILLIPIFLTILSVGISVLCLYTVIYGLSIASVETVDAEVPGGEVKTLDFDEYEKLLLIYEILVYLWVINFLSQIAYYTGAAFQIQWYFYRDSIKYFTLKVLAQASYSLGSIALGSFLIPVAQILKVIFPCFFLFRKKSVIRTITHSAYSYQIVDGTGFFKSGQRVRELLDTSKGVGLDAVRGSRYVHWINSMLVIMIAPVFVAYWLKYQDDTPSGEEEVKRITSYSVMCAVMIFPAWAIARIWYMFSHGMSNSASIAVLHEIKIGLNKVREDDELKKEMCNYLQTAISASPSGDLKSFVEKRVKGTDIEVIEEFQHPDSEEKTDNHHEKEFLSGGGLIRPVSSSGSRSSLPHSTPTLNGENIPSSKLAKEEAKSLNLSQDQHVLTEAQESFYELPKDNVVKKPAHKKSHDQLSINEAHESFHEPPKENPTDQDLVQAKFAPLVSMHEDVDKRINELKYELGSMDSLKQAYSDSHRNPLSASQFETSKPAGEKLEAEDIEGDYENPIQPEGAVPQVSNPKNSSDELEL
jgi:hypothetical protein